MGHLLSRFLILGSIAELAVACRSFEVQLADRENLEMARTSVGDGARIIEESKTTENSEVSELLSTIQEREGEAQAALAKKQLSLAEVRDVKRVLASYKERYGDLVEVASEDGNSFDLAENPEKQARLQRTQVRMSTYLARIEEHLNAYIETQKKAFEGRLRNSVQTLGATLIALDQQYQEGVERQMLKNPEKTAQLTQKKHEFNRVVTEWLDAVDTQLKTLVSTGKPEQRFLLASQLSSAIKLCVDPQEEKDWTRWIDIAVLVAVSFVEELVPQARDMEQDALWALGIVSEEFSKVVTSYKANHVDPS